MSHLLEAPSGPGSRAAWPMALAVACLCLVGGVIDPLPPRAASASADDEEEVARRGVENALKAHIAELVDKKDADGIASARASPRSRRMEPARSFSIGTRPAATLCGPNGFS